MEDIGELVNILEDLRSTSGRIAKEEILKNNSGNLLFTETLKFLLNPYIVTGISKNKMEKFPRIYDISGKDYSYLEMLEYLKTHNTGRDVDILCVKRFIENSKYAEILKQIFTKSIRLGIQATTVNKIYGEDFVPTFDVMLAENYFDNKDFVEGKEFLITTKLDGTRCVAVYDGNNVEFFSRQGQSYGEMPDIEKEIKKLLPGYVYDGELIAKVNKEISSQDLFRETVSRVRKDGKKFGAVFNIFDMIPISDFRKGKSNIIAKDRKAMLSNLFKSFGNTLEWLREVNVLYSGSNTNEIMNSLEKAILDGEEGVMINLSDGIYECRRTKQLLKVKRFRTADVRVIDVYEGTGKNAGRLGGIVVEFEHENKLYNCSVGSGFTDSERDEYWRNKDTLMDKIVEIQYFEISSDADGKYSMRFPVWLGRIREDKIEISMY